MSAASSHHCGDLSPHTRKLAQTIPRQVLSGLFPAQDILPFLGLPLSRPGAQSRGHAQICRSIIKPSTTTTSELMARKDHRGTNSGKERPTGSCCPGLGTGQLTPGLISSSLFNSRYLTSPYLLPYPLPLDCEGSLFAASGVYLGSKIFPPKAPEDTSHGKGHVSVIGTLPLTAQGVTVELGLAGVHHI